MFKDPQSLVNQFFIYDVTSYKVAVGEYDPYLVAVSFVIAILASFVGVRLASSLYNAKSLYWKNILHISGAFAFGMGIWAMHFIGMLAYEMDMVHSYNPLLTGLSMLVATGVAFGVLYIIRKGKLTCSGLVLSSILLGAAICSMHYIGMMAMEMKAALVYKPLLFVASLAIAIAASAAALWIVFKLIYMRGRKKIYWEGAAAIIMGLAICGMHYTGMAAAVFVPFADCKFNPLQSYDNLAFVVVIASTVFFALSLTLSLRGENMDDDGEKEYSGRVVFIQLASLLSLFLILMVGSYYFYINGFKQQSYDRLLLIGVGIEHVYFSEIEHFHHELAQNDAGELDRESLRELIHRVGHNFNGVLNGGTIYVDISADDLEEVPSLRNREIIDQVQKIYKDWQGFKPYLQGVLRGDPIREAYFNEGMDQLLSDLEGVLDTMRFYTEENVQDMLSRQMLLLALGGITFILTLIYARFFIAKPIERAGASLKRHRQELQKQVREQTADLRAAKENAERLNKQMQEYTDKLEILRQEALDERDKAKKASRAKSDFLANMSHELRTPLNSIIGLSRILFEDLDPETDEHFMSATVYKASTNLLDIVNDILDLSKVEAGEITLEKIGFDFKKVLSSVVETLAPIASTRGLSLNYSYKGEDLPYLIGDPLRTSRILTNLIGNAIKYTEEGMVDVEVEFEKTSAMQGTLKCSVIDTGIGIASKNLESIFEKFTQADETTTRKFGGTGLGLAITRELVTMMGGEIHVESELGQGSVFTFEIPFDIAKKLHDNHIGDADSTLSIKKDKVRAKDFKVLVAEDHELNQAFIKKLLKSNGIENYDIVSNGCDAVHFYKADAYDLILMDCHMPEKNGYDATREIRNIELENKKDHVPIIALTADAMVGTRERCIEAGMDEYLSKPIDADRFKSILSNWVEWLDTPDHSHVEKKTSNIAYTKEKDEAQDIVDLSVLELYAETQEEIKGFCELFFERSEESIEVLSRNCTSGENQEWVEVSHRLKGGAAMMGAVVLRQICEEAQLMVNVSAQERRDKLAEIKNAYYAVKDAYNTIIKDF